MILTDAEIIQKANLRYEQIKSVIDFKYGDFDLPLLEDIIAKAVVHDGRIKYIEVPDKKLCCRRKILSPR